VLARAGVDRAFSSDTQRLVTYHYRLYPTAQRVIHATASKTTLAKGCRRPAYLPACSSLAGTIFIIVAPANSHCDTAVARNITCERIFVGRHAAVTKSRLKTILRA